MPRIFPLWPLLSLFVGSALYAQQRQNQDFIEMCGATLRVGTPQESALKSLAVQCNHASMSEDGTAWLITPKDEPNQVVGHVFFKAGRLTTVSKSWTDRPKGPVDIGDALYFAATHLTREGRRSCTIDAFQNDVPDLSYKRFSVFCGRKELRVEVFRDKRFGERVDVEEYLH